MLDALIVGAGISGLSVAHGLAKQGRSLLLAESQDRVGGNITTRVGGEFLWEEGPNSFSPTPELLELIVDVGLRDELLLADRRLPRFIYWQGQLRAVPTNPVAAAKTGLLSPRGKLRALLGALGFVPAPLGEQLSHTNGEETVAEFFSRHLGSEVAERLVAPFVSGVYAGDVHRLSARAAFRRVVELADLGGGLVAGALLARRSRPPKPEPNPNIPQTKTGELGSFVGGLQRLPETIAEKLGDRVKLNWTLTALEREESGNYRARFSTPQGEQQVTCKSVVLAVPAYVAARVLASLLPTVSAELNSIPYPPVACVVLAYPLEAVRGTLQGFGDLIPRGQGIRTLGTIWSSTLFEGRSPQGWCTLTSFIGGATDPEIARLDEEAIAEQVHRDVRRVLLKDDIAPKVLAVNLWRQAIPQYNLGHRRRLAEIEHRLQQLPGLYLCSNYLDGVSLGDCVRRGGDRAREIDRELESR